MTSAEATGEGRVKGRSSLLRSGAGMAGGTILSRISGIVRDSTVVAVVGFATLSDTYSLGNILPNIIYALIAGGALNAVFIPQLVRHMKSDEDGGDAYADRLLTAVTLILTIVSVIAVLAAPLIVRLYATSSYTARDFSVATSFARYCLPQIVFYGVFTLLSQVLNSRGRFAAPMYAPIVNNVVVIGTAVAFLWIYGTGLKTDSITSSQVALLGIGTTLGVVAQALVLIPIVRAAHYRWRLRFDFRDGGLGKAGNLAAWTIGLVLVNQVTYIVITRLATYANVLAARNGLVPVGLTSYQKANLLFILPHSVITVSLVTALLPRMSRAAAEHRLRDVAHDVNEGMRLASAFLVPAAALMVVLGPRVSRLLYGYGSASSAAAAETGKIAAAFALGLVPFTIYYVLLRGWYALEDTKTPFYVNVVLNAINLLVAVPLFVLAAPADKVVALAVGSSAAFTITAVIAWRRLSKRLGGLDTYRTVRTLVRMSLAGLILGGVSFGVSSAIGRALPNGAAGNLIALLVAAGSGFGCYLAAAWAMRIGEVTYLLGALRDRVRTN
jgi:putative peptidoglycan lipid II flippase